MTVLAVRQRARDEAASRQKRLQGARLVLLSFGTPANRPSESSPEPVRHCTQPPLFQVLSAVRTLELNRFRIAHSEHSRDVGASLLFIPSRDRRDPASCRTAIAKSLRPSVSSVSPWRDRRQAPRPHAQNEAAGS